MARPANGTYRFTVTLPGGGISTVTYVVGDSGVDTCTFGVLPWDPVGDCFRRGLIALRCLGDGQFVGINDSIQPPGSYSGTCEKIA